MPTLHLTEMEAVWLTMKLEEARANFYLSGSKNAAKMLDGLLNQLEDQV